MAKKRRRSAGPSPFLLGALVGAAAAYVLLQRNAAAPVLTPVSTPTRPPALPNNVPALGDLPKYAFRPRTKMYI